MLKHLKTEYRLLVKPKPKELVRSTFQILGASVLGAVVLKLVDTGFGALLSLFV